jgi:DNA-binding CsgD family transcriptional regulator
MGDLVLKIGSADFGSEYFRLFNDALTIEHCTVFSFREGECPAALVTECGSTHANDQVYHLAQEYVAGAFRKDPNIQRDRKVKDPVVYTLRADDVRDVEYRHQFYVEPSFSHELVLLGTLNGTLYYSSFYRSDCGSEFRTDDLDRVLFLADFIFKVLQRHVEIQGRGAGRTMPMEPPHDAVNTGSRRAAFNHLKEILLAEPKKLSPREAEVCAAIILGYSTLAISLNLGISLNTVATHRKRAYSKLGICSQNELFGQYFRTIAKLANHRN